MQQAPTVNWNIGISIAIATLVFITSALGGHLASTKLWHKFVFWGFGFVALILISVQAVINEHSQGDLQRQLDKIGTNTQKHATIKITPKEDNLALPQPLSDKHLLGLNFEYLNIGNEAAKRHRLFSHAYVEYGTPYIRATSEKVWQKFSDWMHATDKRHDYGAEFPFGVPAWATNEDRFTLTRQQITDIEKGKAHIFLTVSFEFTDELGRHAQEACMWIQPPADPHSPWHDCGIHNAEIDIGGGSAP